MGNALINFLVILLVGLGIMLIPLSKKTKKFGVILLSVCVFAEVFIFNYHSYHLCFGNYEEKSLSLANAQYSTESLNFINKTTISFKNVDQRIGTLYIDCTLHDSAYLEDFEIRTKKTNLVNVKIDAKDETYSADYRYGTADGVIIRNDEKTKTVILNMSGKVSDLRVTLSADEGCYFSVNGITANSHVPLDISAFRAILIFSLVFMMYLLLNTKTMQSTVEEQSGAFAYSTFVITGIMLAFAVFITVLYNYNKSGILFNSLAQTSGNQISQELVDAFKNGRVTLLDTPPQNLLEMDNPYDWGARIAEGLSYKWDHLLFDGKYYSYYGIAPVLLLFLPFNLLTGYYFSTPEAVMIFGMIGIAFLSLLFYEFIKKFFPRLPLSVAVSSLLVIQFSSAVYYCFASPLFYEIAQSSGFAFTCMGFYFLIKSNVISEGKIYKRHICLSSTCLALAVLCRPTLAVYCVAALLFIAVGLFKTKSTAISKNLNKAKSITAFLSAALIPFVLIGGIQMIYNYVRFGNFFDFGIQYSLTINDFTRAEYHTDFVFIGFWNYLFAAPYVKPEFPFIFSNFSSLNTNGYYFIANRNAIGLFYRAIPSLGLFLAPLAYKKADKKKRLIPSLLLLSVCILCPLVIIFSIWESGYGVRYAADFSWQFILGGMIIIFFLYEKYKLSENGFAKTFITAFFVYSAASAILINSALIYDYLSKSGYLQDAFLSFERLFEFWC
ncbi:MAG: hypothetical protein IJN17_04740 [Clostridia bacterium]|nr:hypothetical protein [Clostridia bacterium]